jgi:DNA-binding MarR family transcriptional regulator
MPKQASPYRPRSLTPIARVHGLDYGVLDELLGYSLRRAQVRMFVAFDDATKGMDMTPPRFTALVIVGANPGLSQSTLGKVLGIARSGAMLMTDWLEGRGLVERRRRDGDARAWGLYLTAKGEGFSARLERKVVQLDRQRTPGLTERDRRQLLGLLDKLAG